MSSSEKTIEFTNILISVPWGYLAGRWYGNTTVRPILALHGWLDNMGTWDTLIPCLPAHIGVLCIDFPGHGRSSKYPPGIIYHAIDYTHIIIRVMKEYNWQRVSLLGHSMGAFVAITYAALYPRTVDMLIAVDVLAPKKISLKHMHDTIEKGMLEDERRLNLATEEPPSFTYDELKQILYNGSKHSVELDKCGHILDHNIQRSKKYPEKYYFSRDGKLKYYVHFYHEKDVYMEELRRIKNVPFLIVKGAQSPYIQMENVIEYFDLLRETNRYFEFHEIEGTHHVHLNNAEKVAAALNPFINRYRPATLDRWSLNADKSEIKQIKQQRSKL